MIPPHLHYRFHLALGHRVRVGWDGESSGGFHILLMKPAEYAKFVGGQKCRAIGGLFTRATEVAAPEGGDWELVIMPNGPARVQFQFEVVGGP